jgi:hypothetical protein
MRKQFPGSTTANGIEDAIEDFAAAVFWWAATGFAGRHERYQRFPFSISKVGIVSGSRRIQSASVNNRPLFKLPLNHLSQPRGPPQRTSYDFKSMTHNSTVATLSSLHRICVRTPNLSQNLI